LPESAKRDAKRTYDGIQGITVFFAY